MPQTIEPFELFAIRYAHHAGRRAADNFIGGDPHEAASPLDYFVWLARRSDRLFVIDTGFAEGEAAARGRQLVRRPAAGLAALGVEAGAVETVILTHLHYDHAGTLGDFPRARFHLQEREMGFAAGRAMCHAHLRHSFAVEDVVALVRRLYAGAVVFHEGDAELAPGLTLHRIGGHTPGLQAVRVWTRRGWVVLASDASHLYAHMEQGRPFPTVENVADMLEGHKRLYALADSAAHIVPGHDPLVMRRYAPPAPALDGLAVRLDAAPRE